MLLLKFLVFLCCIERRAGLVGKVTVAVYLRVGVEPTQVDEQVGECRLLHECAGVLWCLAILGAASNV